MKKLLGFIILIFLAGCAGQAALWFPVTPMPSTDFIGDLNTPNDIPAGEPDEMPADEPDKPFEIPESGHHTTEMDMVMDYLDVARPPMIALTFDDGPAGQKTERILDLLEEHGGRATFFVLGYRVERHRDTIVRAAEMGNEIANHSWSHPRLPQLDADEIAEEIRRTSSAIEDVTGISPPIMRPPFGRTSYVVRNVAEELGYVMVNWTVDTLDWQHRDADRIYNIIMQEAYDGAIILMHDIHSSTIEAMERVIPRLVEEGYELVTVSELMEHFFEGLTPGNVYGKLYEVD